MELYQRHVLALIRDTGARVSILPDHRLVDLWRQYSQRIYFCCWIEADRKEVGRFIPWTNGLCGLLGEIHRSQQERLTGVPRKLCSHPRYVRTWDDHWLVERRVR